jgi:hypothetical protein
MKLNQLQSLESQYKGQSELESEGWGWDSIMVVAAIVFWTSVSCYCNFVL